MMAIVNMITTTKGPIRPGIIHLVHEISKERTSAQKHVDEVLRCYDVLSKATCLGPSPAVNEAFSLLVSISTLVLDFKTTNEILQDPYIQQIIPNLRSLCSSGEGLLESYWAQRIAHSDIEESIKLTDFPYYANYEDLTRLELGLVKTINPTPKKFLFLGSGPLPLTSFCIIDQLASPEVEILNVDCSLLAVVDATAMSRKLGYADNKIVFCCDVAGGTKHSVNQVDVVYLAALVGSDGAEKKQVLNDVVANMKSGALIVIRTAWGLRNLLYPELRIPEDVSVPGLEILVVAHPYNTIVNSVILGRRK